MNKFKEKMQGLWGWIDSLPSIVWAAGIMGLIVGIVWLCAVFPAFQTAIAFGLLLSSGLCVTNALVLVFRGK